MPIELRHPSSLDWEEYAAMFLSGYTASPFCSKEWLELIENSRYDLRLYLLRFSDGESSYAYFPLFSKKFFPFQFMALPLGCYGGFVARNVNDYRLAISELAKSRFVSIMTLNTLSADFGKIFPRSRAVETYITRFDDTYSTFFEKLPGKTRNQIRKARKSGIDISVLEGLDYTEALFGLYSRLVEKHRIRRPFKRDAFRKLCQISSESSALQVVAAFLDDVMIAFSVFLYSSSECFYWLNASDNRYSVYNANDGILDFVLSQLASRQGAVFNWGAVPLGNVGLAHFKSSWNAESERVNIYKGRFAL